jgi:hypothetical protein
MLSFIKYSCIAITFQICFATMANAQAKISGRVLGEQSKPLKDIIVSLVTDSLAIKLANTSENGIFTFDKLPLGTYRIMIILTGYEKFTTGFFTLTKNKFLRNFGDIELKPQR